MYIHVLLMISHHCVIKHYSMKCLVNTDVVFSFLIKFVSLYLCILYVVKSKGLISCSVTTQLIFSCKKQSFS